MAGRALEELKAAGAAARDLVMPGSTWVHRRVQRVSYLEPSLVLVRLSVDFTPPSEGAGSHVPISVLPKWPPLYRFDYRAADDTPVPLLTSEENGVADHALLEALVADVSPESLEDPEFRQAMASLTKGPETHLGEVFDSFRSKLGGTPGDPRRERALEVAAMLPDATLLWWPAALSRPEERTVCKVDYLIRSVETKKRHVRVLRSLSWYQPTEYIPLWHIGADANFHAEVEAPEVLRLRSVRPKFYRFRRSGPGVSAGPKPPREGTGSRRSRPDEYVDREGRLTHVYVSGLRPLAADLLVTFAPARSVVAASAGAAALIALLVTGFYAYRGQMEPHSHIEAAVAVLIDPPLARSYILGTQVLSLLAGAVPLVMAVLLLRFAEEPSCLTTAWLCSLIVSWLIAAALAFSFARAGAPGEEET